MEYKFLACAVALGVLAGCGGGGGGSGSAGAGSTNPPTGPSQTYLTIDDTRAATSTLGGAILDGVNVDGTIGTITHDTQQFVLNGDPTTRNIADSSAFSFSEFDFATDVELSSGEIAIIGVSTATADMPTSGAAAYSGEFRGQFIPSGSPVATPLNWTADIQVGFSGAGDVDMTFAGGGSSAIDEIRIRNATISGNTFSGGSISTLLDGTQNNLTGTSVDVNGTFFGYDNVLTIPGEVGGVMASSGGGNSISGAFITSSQP